MNERGISPPPPLGFIENPQEQDAWWKWFTRIFYAVPKVQTFSKALTPTAVTAGAESVQTFTVTGLTTTDIVTVNKPTNQAGLDLVHAWVSAADTLSIKYRNPSGGNITPTAETYRILAVRT